MLAVERGVCRVSVSLRAFVRRGGGIGCVGVRERIACVISGNRASEQAAFPRYLAVVEQNACKSARAKRRQAMREVEGEGGDEGEKAVERRRAAAK